MKNTFLKSLCLGISLCGLTGTFVNAQDTRYVPAPENLEARKEFSESRFGVFIHWGIYSMPAQGEWYMHSRNIHRDEYAKLASGFCPSRFNAAEWVSAIKASGAKYICITSRHHDGFSMFDTKWSDFDIVDATPFRRDVLKELAEECQKQGIKLHFYYSHLDWRRDDYPANGNTGQHTGREQGRKGDWPSYYRFMNNQLTELLTNYGPIGAIWFDGCWDIENNFDWQLEEQYRMIHQLQPACLVGNNHHKTPYPGEDIQIFERDLPGENKAGFSAGQGISALPLETCETMNGNWGYHIEDRNYKSANDLIQLLVRASGKNANLLMNIGPQPNGEIPAVAVQRFKEIGEWLSRYGETIYGTTNGEVAPQSWGVSTRKGNKLYIHILNHDEKVLFLPMQTKVKKAVRYDDKQKVRFTQDGDGVILRLGEVPEGVDYIVELDA